ncbi:MAG: glycosyltransferase [Burkholderiales bacterium]
MDYSIIVPAYNEQEWLPRTLARLHESMIAVDGGGEIIVVDNNSSDRTAQFAQEHGARVVFEPINQISRTRNAGAREARGKFLIFVDADTLVSPALLRAAIGRLENGCCGGGAGVAFDTPVAPFGRGALALWNWISRTSKLAAGCFIYCTAEGFRAAGGFSESVYASEEIWFSQHLKNWGKQHGLRFEIIEEPRVVTSGRKLGWFSPLRIFFMLLLLAVFPPAVRFRSLCGYWYARPRE